MLSNLVTFLVLASSLSSTLSAPVFRREVPQEHSHEQFLTVVRASLNLNNPNEIKDPVFALLGNAAAAEGLGKLTDANCLQQATADQAFSNSKAANDTKGMVAALIYRALERNTGAVGQVSEPCTSLKAVNAEIAAIQQHQDPASKDAAAVNKAITLELAKQIASVGGDPQQALLAGTFAPGEIGDPTGAGNTCDDANDPVGCIFTLKRIVNDATPEEIDAAVADVKAGGAEAGKANTATATGTAKTDLAKETAVASTASTTVKGDAKETTTTTSGAETSTVASETASTCPPAVTVTKTVAAEKGGITAPPSGAETASVSTVTVTRTIMLNNGGANKGHNKGNGQGANKGMGHANANKGEAGKGNAGNKTIAPGGGNAGKATETAVKDTATTTTASSSSSSSSSAASTITAPPAAEKKEGIAKEKSY